ncbi:MAG TPA: VTT domain-containing protein [Candidatus Paceibacterota bacterium]|nr:VTT domain-containing protein [Candidatus Paceibacterota bacterium]
MLDFLLACIHLDPITILQTGGYLGIAALIFAESGLFLGIFLPGDSLLFAAGLLATNGFFVVGPLIMIVVVAAIVGDSVGYWFGSEVGERLFDRKDSRFFKQEYLRRTERFYKKYGGRAVVLARFVPIVRTLAPILAGVSTMKYRVFLAYNMLGAFLWGTGMILLGFLLGSIIPNSEKYILPLSLVIVVVSFLPIFLNLARGKRAV